MNPIRCYALTYAFIWLGKHFPCKELSFPTRGTEKKWLRFDQPEHSYWLERGIICRVNIIKQKTMQIIRK